INIYSTTRITAISYSETHLGGERPKDRPAHCHSAGRGRSCRTGRSFGTWRGQTLWWGVNACGRWGGYHF
ncbi:mCG141828, partial [Mus musculus]